MVKKIEKSPILPEKVQFEANSTIAELSMSCILGKSDALSLIMALVWQSEPIKAFQMVKKMERIANFTRKSLI
jgi:hypothetical protein